MSGSQGRFGRVRKIPPSPEFDLRNVQLVASRYTDWAIGGPQNNYKQVTVIKSACFQHAKTHFSVSIVLLLWQFAY
jgi:hypothetical protein